MTFTASNGVKLDGYGCRVGVSLIAADAHEARKEFYQHLRDEELGRWRWPANPDYVVYPIGDDHPADVQVVRESDGCVATWCRDWNRADDGSEFRPAALAYFDAHPVRKPWHDAQPGDAWVLYTDFGEHLYVVFASSAGGYEFRPAHREPVGIGSIALAGTAIHDGRRIWPEAS